VFWKILLMDMPVGFPGPEIAMPPPLPPPTLDPRPAELLANVESVTERVPVLAIPPPDPGKTGPLLNPLAPAAELPLKVVLVTERVPVLAIPPPLPPLLTLYPLPPSAELPLKVELVSARDPALEMPPPLPPT
jgi:hypothetical protein